jgi:ATP diphosphatase
MMTSAAGIERLLEIMAALRTPGTGCPWDLEQSFETIVPYTLEEAYEVADAVQRGDLDDLKDELGDLLLQVVFHARMAEERGAFAFADVVEAITSKLIRRHPHVFGKARNLPAAEVKRLWEEIKRAEKAERQARSISENGNTGLLAGVPLALPALSRAEKLTRKAATVGFDWPDWNQVVDKIDEELEEIREAAAEGSRARIEDEVGDLLFAAANLARHFGIDAEGALRGANAKFERRFGSIETALAEEGRSPERSNLEEMERLWNEAKVREKRDRPA